MIFKTTKKICVSGHFQKDGAFKNIETSNEKD
jgi:hypothetical protein